MSPDQSLQIERDARNITEMPDSAKRLRRSSALLSSSSKPP